MSWTNYPVKSEPGPQDQYPEPPQSGLTLARPLAFRAGMGSVTKEGTWTVPPYLQVDGGMGSIRLDFQRATALSKTIWVNIEGGAGSIYFILPEGWAAQLNDLRPGWGSRKSKVRDEPNPPFPTLVISGSLGMGSLTIRYPNRWDLRRLAKALARENR